MYTKLTLPAIALAAGLYLFTYMFFYFDPTKASSLALIVGGVWCLAALLWVGWDIWDWSNDYYFVTNQRVVWLEKVAGIYESRQEAPLSTILSVGVESDQIGRMVGFGNVVVRTYTGSIPLRRVKNPNIIASIIEEQLRRSQITLQKEEASEMDNAIRTKLGLTSSVEEQETIEDAAPLENSIRQTVNPGVFKRLFGYLFQVRFDVGEVVTYRKHWFILLAATWKQTVLFSLIAAALISDALGLISWISNEGIITLLAAALIIVFLWWFYDVIDWHNDIYQVSADQIIDINRKPFGTETKKTAPLENILSIEYERSGIIGLVFNYGTVKIKIGNASFDFDYVFNPSRVQHDIFRRKLEKEAKRKKAEREAERERLSSWIATYHHYNEEIPKEGQTWLNPPPQVNPGETSQEVHRRDEDDEDRDGFGWIN